MVDCIRQRFQIQRVGHGGTLDPLATGLLILLLGKATRQARLLLDADKTYVATLRLGIETDTQDVQGRVLQTREVGPLSLAQIEAAFQRFQGQIEQEVPAYSAVRIQGRRSYELARAGIAIPRRTRQVMVRELKILAVRPTEVDFRVTCSKGTYVRALCADIGSALGVGGILSRLRRIQIGSFLVEDAVAPEATCAEHVLPLESLSS